MSFRLFLRSLRQRRDWRGPLSKRLAAGLKYAARSARMARRQSAWLGELYGSARLTAYLGHDPRLHERWHHHYINRRLGRAQRMAVISSHYRFAFDRLPTALVDAVYLQGRYELGALTLKDGSQLLLELRRPTGRSREGELSLCLANTQGQLLSSMIFSIAEEGRMLLVGCVQGAANELGREAVRELTKQCYGLRPKNLLFSLLLAFGSFTGAQQIRGVSNLVHPFAGNANKIKADYDSFWEECQGVLQPDGFFALPTSEPERDESQVESKHRSAFRRRELLRREACARLLAALRAQPLAWPQAA
ncbi:VirK/YbjX family protein [Dyella sp. 20L07]|uniref:VirK/YbjX family protein n=1 Tax=Dyella sp. 20L07 TaxID=3384240 RepID=UPI003D278B69